MMGKKLDNQPQFIYVDLEELIPADHLLRAILRLIDFSFIYEKVQHLYSPVGRKSVDPVLLIKMLLLGYLYGIPSERKLEQEVKLNLAYRWFLGLELSDDVPDHSTLSQNRRRRFRDNNVFQEIFDEVVLVCVKGGLVTGEVLVTDSTHIKAYASNQKLEKVRVTKTPSNYLRELEQEADKIERELNDKRDSAGKKKRGSSKKQPSVEPEEKEIIRSTTDPECGMMNRPRKPSGFHYLSHTTVDTNCGIITDIFVTPGNVNDNDPFIERLALQKEKFGLNIQNVGADKGYDCSSIHHGLEQLGIIGHIAIIERDGESETKEPEFSYDEKADLFICPAGKPLTFSHIERNSTGSKFRKIYGASTKDCKSCSFREVCVAKSKTRRLLKRPLHHAALERSRIRSNTNEYRVVQRLRRIWSEGTFGIMKQQHNLAKTYKRGIRNVLEQCLFSALAINIKRMVKAFG